MILRRDRRQPHPPRVGRGVAVATRSLAAAALAALPIFAVAPGAGAQVAPSDGVIPPDVIARAHESMGVITANQRATVGWIAASGIVVTSDEIADEVGTSVQFQRATDDRPIDCYAARVDAHLRLAVLRCDKLRGTPIKVASGYPTPGTPVFVTTIESRDDSTMRASQGSVEPGSVEFMHTTRPQFTPATDTLPTTARSTSDVDETAGAPIVGADGRVISTILVAADGGGPPLGTVPTELTKLLADSSDLPPTFQSAAVLTAARRALIPVLVGLGLGILWSAVARDGRVLARVVGMTALGLVGAVAYTFFTALVVGPQTLVG